MKPTFGVMALVAICFLSTATLAQRNIEIGSPVTENFNGLTTSTVNVTNNTTPIAGFYTTRTSGNATPNSFFAGTGSSSTSQLYNFGSAGAVDRAAGSVQGAGTGTVYHGMRLVNSGSTMIGSITVEYTGEEWRRGAGGTPALNFSYQTGVTVTSLTAGTWTAVAALDFAAPNVGGGAGALNGNTAGNRTTLSSTFVINLEAGQEIMLRWTNASGGGQLWGLAIDDLTVTAIGPSAADAYITGRVSDAFGRSIGSAAITVQDLTGTSRVVYTNTFGYYRIDGLEAGQTYVLSVSSRRHSFTNASMLVNLSDNVDGANFVARR